jgi:LAO/AO transport system kinase
MMNLVENLLTGDRLALARLLTHVENDSMLGRQALDELFNHTGNAHLVGVTGPPGVGKSSLVNQLTLHYRKNTGKTIAIVAVDPTSPFSGGAVMGDRVRMRDLSGDKGVFIRSMASRGTLGGLAHATAALTQVFDAAGFNIVLIETVGAGQAEVDIARLAHTTLVIEAPGMGDDIQAIKAGILEIADILVINKADRPGIEHTEATMRGMLEMAYPVRHVFQHHGRTEILEPVHEAVNSLDPSWLVPIHKTVATDGSGIPELVGSIERHAEFLERSGEWSRRERTRLETELDGLIQDSLTEKFLAGLPKGKYDRVLAQILERRTSPWEAVKELMNGRSG